MLIQLQGPKPDPTLDWHEWYAWRPVIARDAGYYTANLYRGPEYLVWRRYIMRRKHIVDSTVHWLYELRCTPPTPTTKEPEHD